MTTEQEKYIEYYKGKKNYFRDPEIMVSKNIIILNPRKIGKWDLVGELILLTSVPLIAFLFTRFLVFPLETILILISFSALWIFFIIIERIKRIEVNNRIEIDFQNKIISIIPIDYLRMSILKMENKKIGFDSFEELILKRRKFDKFNAGVRIVVKTNRGKLNLLDFWTTSLGEGIAEIVSDLTNTHFNWKKNTVANTV